MPQIDKITPVLHNALDPYHVDFDNLPLINIIERQNLINSAVDNIAEILTNAKGTQGTLSNRLNQSIDEAGNLKVEAIDDVLHSIEAHSDTENFVRMTSDERAKLETVDSGANFLQINVESISNISIIEFDNGVINITPSSTINWEIESPNTIKAHIAFDSDSLHIHYYEIVPSTEDYQNFSLPIAFKEDSLKVFINGTRIPKQENGSVYVYSNNNLNSYYLTNYTANHSAGTFYLNRIISENDIIFVDFERTN